MPHEKNMNPVIQLVNSAPAAYLNLISVHGMAKWLLLVTKSVEGMGWNSVELMNMHNTQSKMDKIVFEVFL